MRRILAVLCCLLALGALPYLGGAVQYEPPLNIVFIIHVEDIPGYTGYQTRIQCLQWLEAEALSRPYPFKMTVLMNGDFCEYAIYMGDQDVFASLESNGHELGTHAHPIVRMGPLNWVNVQEQTYRYGIPIYGSAVTQQVWSDAKFWVDSLSTVNQIMTAMPFLCSDEGQLMTQFGYISDPGQRSEKGLDYTGHLVRHPFRPAADDRLGYELKEDLSAPFVYIDHYAQIGNTNAHGYNCTEPAMEVALNQCYQEWLAAEMAQGDSLDYKVWTFGFLTHDWLWNNYYEQQVSAFLDFIEANFVGQYTPRGNLIARYSTCSDVVAEYEAWETTHPGQSSYSYVHPYPQNPKMNEAMILPQDLTQASEWIEIYNPTSQWMNISSYEINQGLMFYSDFWRFPPNCWIGPTEYALLARNGQNFKLRYGFRPDYEVDGNTGARPLFPGGNFTMHDDHDCAALVNNDNPTPNTNTTITDALSWGQCYTAGFTLNSPAANQTYGRDANSTDTGFASDWRLNGGAQAPTPAGANSNSFFAPEIFVRTDPATVPLIVQPGGGQIRFYIKAGNEFPTVQVVDFWTTLLQPNGTITGPLIVRLNKNLPAHDSLTVSIIQSVTGASPAGFYRYNVYVGDYPNVITDVSYFYFEKLGSQDGPLTAWPKAEVYWPDERYESALEPTIAPDKLSLAASPNPFNATTTLRLSLPQAGDVSLEAFDISGRMVFHKFWENLPAGSHPVDFDGANLASGSYIVQLRSKLGEATTRVLLVK